MPHLPYLLAFDRRPDLVLQDHGIDTVPALHAAEGFDVVFAGVIQVVVPLGHEQARATSAGSRRRTVRSREGTEWYLHFPSVFIVPPRIASLDSILRSMIQPPGCWFDAMCSWLQNVTASSAVGDTVAPSHDRSMNGS